MNKGNVKQVRQLRRKFHWLRLGGHFGWVMLGHGGLGMGIFTLGAFSGRVAGYLCPDHLHVGINLLHQLPQAIHLLLFVWIGWVMNGRDRDWNGDLIRVPKRGVLGHP